MKLATENNVELKFDQSAQKSNIAHDNA